MAFLSDRLNGLRFTPSPQSPAVAGMFASIGVNQIVPDGWFLCDGTEYDSALYPELFAAIGTAYNTGGETLGFFRVPNGPSRTQIVDNSVLDLVTASAALANPPTSVQLAEAYAYSDAIGNYKLNFNVRYTIASPQTSSRFRFTGATFLSTQGQYVGSQNEAALATKASGTEAATNNIFADAGAASNIWRFSGDILLDGKPTWYDANLDSKPIIKVYTDDGAVALQGSGTQSGNAAADGDFLSGNIYYERTDNICTITTDTILTHASLSDAATSVGFLPSYMRPSLHRVSNTYFYDETNGATVFIETDGQIAVAYRDEAGTVARVDTAEPLTISYRLI